MVNASGDTPVRGVPEQKATGTRVLAKERTRTWLWVDTGAIQGEEMRGDRRHQEQANVDHEVQDGPGANKDVPGKATVGPRARAWFMELGGGPHGSGATGMDRSALKYENFFADASHHYHL